MVQYVLVVDQKVFSWGQVLDSYPLMTFGAVQVIVSLPEQEM